jgi:predicted membrane protein
MRASNPKPTPTRKPNLQVIPGALSLYRVGDVITFDLNEVEFEARVESVEIEAGKAVLWVTCALGVHAGHVKRVERRPS